MRFPVKFVNIFWTPILQNICEQLSMFVLGNFSTNRKIQDEKIFVSHDYT